MDRPLEKLFSTKKPVILDGAMGTELHRRGIDTGLPLWSANALIAHPEIVLQIHKEYIAAGADIITTNTFRTTRRTMRRANLPDRSKALTSHAINLAHEARGAFSERAVLIAGSMAPLEDCYRPDLVPQQSELQDEHTELAGRLADGNVDFLLIETMGTIREAVAASEAALKTRKEFIVSFICDNNGKLYGGEELAHAISSVSPLKPSLICVNCVSPRYLASIIPILTTASPIPFGVYANVGLPDNERRTGNFMCYVEPETYAACAASWIQQGASLVGGCCGTTPEHVSAIRAALV